MYTHLCEKIEDGGLGFDIRQAGELVQCSSSQPKPYEACNAPNLFRELMLGCGSPGRLFDDCLQPTFSHVSGLLTRSR